MKTLVVGVMCVGLATLGGVQAAASNWWSAAGCAGACLYIALSHAARMMP